MIYDGLKLMVAGMGTVFLFLVLMIFIVNGLAKILAPFAGILEPKKDPKKSSKTKKNIHAGEDKALVTAIISAVHQYREDRKL